MLVARVGKLLHMSFSSVVGVTMITCIASQDNALLGITKQEPGIVHGLLSGRFQLCSSARVAKVQIVFLRKVDLGHHSS